MKAVAKGTCVSWVSHRARVTSVYGLNTAVDAAGLLSKLGKHKAGKGCVYIRTLADVDQKVLAELVASAAAEKSREHS